MGSKDAFGTKKIPNVTPISIGNFFLICVKRSKAPHSHQIRENHFQTIRFIYRQFLRKKVYFFFWHSETMEKYIQNFRLFSLPKTRFSKIRENYYKNSVKSPPKIYLTFLTKKSMCEFPPPPTKSGQNIFFKF